jgi:hypothetical protein
MAPALIGAVTPEDLNTAVSRLPGGVFKARNTNDLAPTVVSGQITEPGSVKEGGYAERDGKIFVRCGEALEPLNVSASAAARIRGMLSVRDAVREVFRTQLFDAPDEQIAAARRRLNHAYDSFKPASVR